MVEKLRIKWERGMDQKTPEGGESQLFPKNKDIKEEWEV